MEEEIQEIQNTSRLQEFLKMRFGWPPTFLEILSLCVFLLAGMIHCIIFSSYLDFEIVHNDSNRYPTLKALSITSPFLGFYGAVIMKLNQGLVLNTILVILLIIIPLTILVILISKGLFMAQVALSVVCIFIPCSVSGIHLFKIVRNYTLFHFNARRGEYLVIALNVLLNLLFNIVVSVLLVHEKGLKDPKILIQYSAVLFLIILIIIWGIIHPSVFKREISEIQSLRQEVLQNIDNSIRVQVILQDNPGVLKIEKESSLNRNGNLIASLGILIAFVSVEIGLIAEISQFNDRVYKSSAVYLAIFYIVAVPAFLFSGIVFSSSKLSLRHKYLSALLLVSFIPSIFVMWFSYYLSTYSSTFYIAMVIGFGFPGSLVYWLTLSMVFRYNKRTFQYFSAILCLVLVIPIGLILPFYLAGGMKLATFWVTLSLLFFFGIVLLILWVVQFLLKMTKQLFLLLREFKVLNSGHFSLYIYSISFIIGYCLVSWRLFKSVYEKNNWTSGYLAGSYVILALCLIYSLYLQKVKLYKPDPLEPEESIIELIRGKSKTLSELENRFKLTKVRSQLIVLLTGIVLTLLIAIPVISAASISAGVTIFVGGLLSTLLFLFLLEFKHFLKRYGQKATSYLLSCCWLFCLVPIVVLIPVTLSGAQNEEETRDVTSWSIGSILLLFMIGVSIGSICLNLIFNQLEYEKIAKYCCSAVQEILEANAVKSGLIHLRGIYDNLINSSPAAVKKVLIAQTVYSFREFDGDDFRFSKEILTVKEVNKYRTESFAVKKKKTFGISDFCKKLFGKKAEVAENPNFVAEENIEKEENATVMDDFKDNWDEKFKDDLRKQEQFQIESERMPESRGAGIEQMLDLSKIKFVRMGKNKKSQLMASKELQNILLNESIRNIWLRAIFTRFSSGTNSGAEEPWMNLSELRHFIRLAGLSQSVPRATCDLLFVRFTKIYDSQTSQVTTKKIDYDTFIEKLLPELAKLCFPNEDSLNGLIREQLFPYLVNSMPYLQNLARTEGSDKELVDRTSLDPPSADTKRLRRMEKQLQVAAKLSGLFGWLSKCSSALFRSVLTCCINVFDFSSFSSKPDLDSKLSKTKIEVPEDLKERQASPDWEKVCEIIVKVFEETDKEIRENIYGKHISMTMNLANVTAIVGHLAEIYSFSSLGFSSQVGWKYGSAFTRTSSVVLAENEYWVETYWTCFGCTVVFISLLYPTFKLLKQGRLGLNKDFTVAEFPSPNFLLSKALGILASSLYLTIMCSFLSAFSCIYSNGSWHLLRDSSIVCFSAQHSPYFIISIFSLVFYYPASTLIYPNLAYQDKALDIKFDSTYLILESQGKVFIAGFAVFFAKEMYIGLQLTVSICVAMTMFCICLKTRPCLVQSYNFWKTGGFLIPAWVCSSALVNYYTGMTELAVALLVVGIGFIVGGLAGGYFAIFKARKRIGIVVAETKNEKEVEKIKAEEFRKEEVEDDQRNEELIRNVSVESD